MRVIRAAYKDRDSNKRKPAKWYLDFVDHNRLRYKIPTFAEAEQKAVTFLPDFGNFVLSTCLDKFCTRQEISIDNQRHKNSQDTLKTAILAENKIPPRGVEPLSPG